MGLQIDLCLLLARNLQACFVHAAIQTRATAQAGFGFRRTDKLYDRLKTDQRLSGPIAGDVTEQAMLNRIPLGGTGRVMRHRNGQIEFVRQLLQAEFPQPTTTAVRTAPIGLNQQSRLAAMLRVTDREPPGAQRGNGERRRLMRSPNDDIASVAAQIVNTIGNRFAFCVPRKVGCEHIQRLAAPGATRIFERPDELFFLRIDANHGQFGLREAVLKARDVAKLLVPLCILAPAQTLAVAAQGIAFEFQQARHGRAADAEWLGQLARERRERFTRPFQTRQRIACGRIGQQLLYRRDDARSFFSTSRRPAPGLRIRPGGSTSGCAISCLPR
jgi:hypothetical protein